MLSIGKVGMSAGQQMYYEQQVAAGREDYYAGRGEAPGRWTGSGAVLLGLEGELDAEQLKAMMDGRHPATSEQLASRSGNSSVAALDLTFSAPKSVSVLFAIGDEELSAALAEAHEEAVDAALSYMEQEACRVRRGHNGTKEERAAGDPRGWEHARSERAGGFVTAAYRHRMSRAQDPQLHTHAVCANMARGSDGRWTALDGSVIYEHAKAAGFVYEAHLRQAVRERVPWAEWGAVREGIAELAQVPVGVRDEFSTRRRQILERERELETAGIAVGHAGRERIAFATRDAKHEIDEGDWRELIRVRAAEHGLGKEELDRLRDLAPSVTPDSVTEGRLAARLFSPTGVTATQNTFRRRDVVIAVAAGHAQGASAGHVRASTARMLERPEVVQVGDGRDARYTTGELLQAEEVILTHAIEGRGRRAGILNEQHIDGALGCLRRPLSAEQERVVREIVMSGSRIDTVEALAGTGKTTSAAALREVYERAGYRVLGAAPTARATRELRERAGISEARTLDAWALKLEAEPHALSQAEGTAWGSQRTPAVLIIDEAGMANTRLSARVIDQAVEAGVKVIAIGDSGQLSSVQAGGWLGALTRELGSHELREVMRQRDPHERRQLAKVQRGEPDEYLQLKTDRRELRVFPGEHAGADAEQAAISQWLAAREMHGEDQAVLICRDNQRRERLNQLARQRLAELGGARGERRDRRARVGGR